MAPTHKLILSTLIYYHHTVSRTRRFEEFTGDSTIVEDPSEEKRRGNHFVDVFAAGPAIFEDPSFRNIPLARVRSDFIHCAGYDGFSLSQPVMTHHITRPATRAHATITGMSLYS